MKLLLQKALAQNHLVLADHIQGKLIRFLELLLQWNRVFRLTAISDPSEAVWLHLIDSLVIMPWIQGERIIDVGSGGGLPGIPLALVFPEKQFFLLDSNGKKARFLQQAVLELELPNVSVVHARAEDWHPDPGFDLVMTRAFSTLRLMLTQTAHLVREGGIFLAMKGAYPEKELSELPHTHRVSGVHRLSVAGLDAERHLVCLMTSKD